MIEAVEIWEDIDTVSCGIIIIILKGVYPLL